MKVQCPSCREIIEMEDFSTSDEGLRFSCPDCYGQNYLPNPSRIACKVGAETQKEEIHKAAAPLDPPTSACTSATRIEGPESSEEVVVCPKCGHAQTDNEACHHCGLSFALFDSSSLPPDPPEAAELWIKVLESPDDLDIHDQFVTACNEADRMDYAHRQYRIFERETGRYDVADTIRNRIQELVQGQVSAFTLSSPVAYSASYSWRKPLWIGVAVIGLIWIAYVIMDSLGMFNS